MPRGVEDRIQQRRDDWDHHDLGHAFRRLIRSERWQDLDLEIVQRQIGGPRHDVSPEVPLPVARAVLERWERLEQRITDAHCKTALRLSQHYFGDEDRAAFHGAVAFGNAERPGGTLDLDADRCAASRRKGCADPVVTRRWKGNCAALAANKFVRSVAYRQRIYVGRPFLPGNRECCL